MTRALNSPVAILLTISPPKPQNCTTVLHSEIRYRVIVIVIVISDTESGLSAINMNERAIELSAGCC